MTDTSDYEELKRRVSPQAPLNLGLNDGTYAPAASIAARSGPDRPAAASCQRRPDIGRIGRIGCSPLSQQKKRKG